MAIQINGITMSSLNATLETRAKHTYAPGRIVYNGQGLQQVGGLPSITLSFNWLSGGEWTWFVTTLLSGARSKLCIAGNTILYDDDLVATTYTACVLHKPTFARYENGLRRDVEVKITALVEV